MFPGSQKNLFLPDTLLLTLGASQQLHYAQQPVVGNRIKWLSDNPAVVSVTQKGYIKALKVGEARITAQASNGLCSNCVVIVPEPCLRFYVWSRNGEIHGYDLEERPAVSMGEKIFTLTSSRTMVEYEATDVLRFTLQDAAVHDPVTNIVQPKDSSDVSFRDGMFTLHGGTPHAPVYVYDASGRLLDMFEIDETGALAFSIATYGTGVYIIKTEKTTIKIKKQ